MSRDTPDGWRAALAGVQAALRAGELAAAKRRVDAALLARPEDADARYLAAVVASREDRHAVARAHLLAVVAARPALSAAWLALGNAELALDAAPAAEAAFERAIALAPELAEAHYNLGLVRKRRHDWAEAAKSFLRALAVQPLLFDAGQQVVDTVAQWVLAEPRINDDTVPAPAPLERAPSISVVICSVDGDKFRRVCALYERLLAGVTHQIVGIHDARSLCEAYNRALRDARGEVVIFSHDDVDILAADFAARLVAALGRFDVVGVAGATRAAGPAWSWAGHPHVHGWITHRSTADGGWLVSISSPWPVVGGAQVLDGVLLAGWRHAFDAVRFDAATFDGFHFYDVDFTLRAARAGWRVGICAELLLVHDSEGRFDADWSRYADRFRAKYPELDAPAGVSHRYEARMPGTREAAVFYRRLAQLVGTIDVQPAASSEPEAS
ncbi:MAG: glycosyltransferase [Casimicrobiaceae bacterium]